MLAELAAANAAFAVIKEAINNGGELAAVGAKVGEYFGLKSTLSKKANKGGSDSEEFWALEALRKQEEELKTLMIYQGRPGLWYDWLKFQSQKKKEREEEERQKQLKIVRRKELLYEVFMGLLISIIGISGIGVLVLIGWAVLKGKI